MSTTDFMALVNVFTTIKQKIWDFKNQYGEPTAIIIPEWLMSQMTIRREEIISNPLFSSEVKGNTLCGLKPIVSVRVEKLEDIEVY